MVQENICSRNDLPFQPYRIFQLLKLNDNSNKLNLLNCVIFKINRCQPEWKIVSSFSSVDFEDFKWTSDEFLVNYRNFNNCEINFYLNEGRVGLKSILRMDDKSKTNRIIMHGLLGEMFNLFAEKQQINFNLDSTAVEKLSRNWWKNEMEYYFFEQLTPPFRFKRFHAMELSSPFMYMTTTFTVTPGALLSPAENLYMPFDWEVWISFVLSIIIGLICIAFVKTLPKSVQYFVFGRNNNDAILNLTQVFFGIGLIKVSGRNFARYLFMVFTLYCLIIRSAYQGKMFEFITGNLRHPTAKTMQDVCNMELPILVSAEHYVLENSK